MADNLFGGGVRQCVMLLSLQKLGELIYVPPGGAITGIEWDDKRKLIKIGVTGGVSGSIVKPGGTVQEVTGTVMNNTVSFVSLGWPDQASADAEIEGKPPSKAPALNMGLGLVKPPEPEKKPEEKILEFPSEPKPEPSPCEPPRVDDE